MSDAEQIEGPSDEGSLEWWENSDTPEEDWGDDDREEWPIEGIVGEEVTLSGDIRCDLFSLPIVQQFNLLFINWDWNHVVMRLPGRTGRVRMAATRHGCAASPTAPTSSMSGREPRTCVEISSPLKVPITILRLGPSSTRITSAHTSARRRWRRRHVREPRSRSGMTNGTWKLSGTCRSLRWIAMLVGMRRVKSLRSGRGF